MPAYCTVYTCSWQTNATVSVWDTVTITPHRGQQRDAPLQISVSARSGGMADHSHTMSLHLDLPQGWTYTSASGRFSTAPAPVPGPTTLALLVCGLTGLTMLHRRRGSGRQ